MHSPPPNLPPLPHPSYTTFRYFSGVQLFKGLEVVDHLLRSLIGGHDDDAVIVLDFLQEVGDFLVGILIMGILHTGSFAKEGIGLVKEKDLATELGFFK